MKTLQSLFAILFIATLTLTSCDKKDEPEVVTECFSNSYNGTYNGTGTVNGIPNTSMSLTLTKLSCTSCKLETGNTTVTVASLQVSSNGGYEGKDGNGDDVSLALNGNELEVQSSKINFTGVK